MDSSVVKISRGAVDSLKPSGEIFSFLAKKCILGGCWGAGGAATSEIRLSTEMQADLLSLRRTLSL